MTVEIIKDKIYSFEEYLEVEELAPYKNEYRNGLIVPMIPGTIYHGSIIGNIFFHLKMAAKNQNLDVSVHLSMMKVFIEPINHVVYPDGQVVFGKLNDYKGSAITNPSILIEVLSDETAKYDKGEKFRKYQLLPSFKEYVLIEQDTPVIDVLVKKENGKWEMSSFVGLDDVLELTTLDIKIPLSDIYEDVKNLSIPQYKIDLD